MKANLYLSTPLYESLIKCREAGIPITVAKAYSNARSKATFYYGSKIIIEQDEPSASVFINNLIYRKHAPLRYRVLIRSRDFALARLLLGDLREGWA